MRNFILTIITLMAGFYASAQDIRLPAPHRTGGKPLMEALALRSTNRSMDPAQALSRQQLSDMLWAAWGINRPDGRRTAASALNRQEIDLYVVGRDNAYRYDAPSHTLKIVATGDLRRKVSSQEFARTGCWILLYVADYRRMMRSDDAQGNAVMSAVDAGLIAQNVYLFGASEELAVVVHASIDRTTAAEALGLDEQQHIIIAQTIGIPAK